MRFFAAALLLLAVRPFAAADPIGIYAPRHGYDTQLPQDRFSRFEAEWKAGRQQLDASGELPFLRSLLAALEVPVSSQMLVFTATSLQKGRISARNPRALYFNDDTYVGFVPGGQIEVVSLDPALGGIFYILDRLQPGRPPRAQRSDDCLNCHAPRHLDNVPGLVIESVVPGLTGGGEMAFRREQSGHGIALGDRFGGWHVTGGGPALPRHWGDLLIERAAGVAREIPNAPGQRFDLARYPAPTSDLLAHLLHEHQAGFVNRALQAAYRWRALDFTAPPPPAVLAGLARPLVRYLLFADETPLPDGALGDSPFAADFSAHARRDAEGRSLRDLDGRTRLLRHRCSYMIYSPAFTGLPAPLKAEIFRQLRAALDTAEPDAAYVFLPPGEKSAIREILRQTLPEFSTPLHALQTKGHGSVKHH